MELVEATLKFSHYVWTKRLATQKCWPLALCPSIGKCVGFRNKFGQT